MKEIYKLNKKYIGLEDKTENIIRRKIEKENKKYKEELDLQMKQFILEKELKIQSLINENIDVKEKLNECLKSSINLKDHENLIIRIKNVFIQ